jgi:hypothetical protein
MIVEAGSLQSVEAAFVDPESADQQERASRRAQELVGTSSVFFDLGAVGVIDGEDSGGRQKQRERGTLGTNHAIFNELRQRQDCGRSVFHSVNAISPRGKPASFRVVPCQKTLLFPQHNLIRRKHARKRRTAV